MACDKSLIRIGDNWYRFELHGTDDCGANGLSSDENMTVIKVESILENEIDVKHEVGETALFNEMGFAAAEYEMTNDSIFDQNPLDDNESDQIDDFDEKKEKRSRGRKKTKKAEENFEEIEEEQQEKFDDIQEDYEDIQEEYEEIDDYDDDDDEYDENEDESDDDFEEYTAKKETKSKKTSKSTAQSSKTPAKRFTCSICTKHFAKKQYLRNHLKYVHNGAEPPPSKLYTCQFCGEKFIRKYTYEAHVADHLDESPHKCVVCAEPFLLESTLQVHYVRMHKVTTNHKLYDCVLCTTSYATIEAFSTHRREVHTNLGLLLKCDECEKRVSTEQALLAHMKRFHMETDQRRQYTCYMCPKKFCLFKNLQYHMHNHTGCRPFDCVVCDRAFFNPSALRQHLIAYHKPNVIVEREKKVKEPKKHICSYCGKIFKFRCALREHLNLHTGARPYQCKVCLKFFPSDRHMRNHQMTHSDRRPHVCDIGGCTRGYKELRDLRRHKFSVHGIPSHTMFTCPACSKTFPDNTLYRKHMRSHENE